MDSLVSCCNSGIFSAVATCFCQVFQEGDESGLVGIAHAWASVRMFGAAIPEERILPCQIHHEHRLARAGFAIETNREAPRIGYMEWNARVTIRLGAVLELTFETLNLGKAPLMVSGALHTYLRVGDVENIRILGLEDTTYLDTVGERTVRKQEGIIVIDRQVDRIYDSSGSVRLEDPDLKRTILVEKTGSPSTVVWNPWIEKAIALGDLPDDGYKDFVCIEAAIANDHAVEMKSGESHSFSTRIGVA